MRLFSILLLSTALLGGPAHAADEFTDFIAAAKAAKVAYEEGDKKRTLALTKRALELMAEDPRYSQKYQYAFIDQYLQLTGKDTDRRRDAARDMLPHFERLALASKLSNSLHLELEGEIFGALKGRNGAVELRKAHEWRQDLYAKVTDDPWVPIALKLSEIVDLRTKTNPRKTVRAFETVLEKAQALDPRDKLVRDIKLHIGKFDIERGKPATGRKKLNALVEEWSVWEEPPELEIIKAMGMIAGTLAEANKMDEMAVVFQEMLQHDKPKQCEPIPVFQRQPKVQCRACNTEGYLLVEYDIMPDGTVDGVEILDEDIPKAAREDILEAFEEWRFYPAVEDSVPIKSEGRRVAFKLTPGRPR